MALSTEQQRLAEDYFSEVKRIAAGYAKRVPSHVQLDELVSAGTDGLMDGVAKYDPSRTREGESPFPYLRRRINGAIMDYMRAQDLLTRDERTAEKRIGRQLHDLRHPEALETPIDLTNDDEVAKALGISIEAFRKSKQRRTTVNFDGLKVELESDTSRADENVETMELTGEISRIMDRDLTIIEQDVIRRHIMGDLTQLDIAEKWDVTESRICQIVGEAIRKIRKSLSNCKRRIGRKSGLKYNRKPDKEKQETITREKDLRRLYKLTQLTPITSRDKQRERATKNSLLRTITPVMNRRLTETERNLLIYFLFQGLSEKQTIIRLKITAVQFKVMKMVALARLFKALAPRQKLATPRKSAPNTPVRISESTRTQVLRALETIRSSDDTASPTGSGLNGDDTIRRLYRALGLTEEQSPSVIDRVITPIMSGTLTNNERYVLEQSMLGKTVEEIASQRGLDIGQTRLTKIRAVTRLELALGNLIS
ncbi:MAG: sigma-70 family RNA polymerase sigma factor [Candidatus Gracilibacteria bacterium]|jgi:RNA polymerase sigma factor for flagellar operon FliA